MRPLVKKLIDAVQRSRTHYGPAIRLTVSKTRNELLLVFAITVHELVFWSNQNKESELLVRLKNLEMNKLKLLDEGIQIT